MQYFETKRASKFITWEGKFHFSSSLRLSILKLFDINEWVNDVGHWVTGRESFFNKKCHKSLYGIDSDQRIRQSHSNRLLEIVQLTQTSQCLKFCDSISLPWKHIKKDAYLDDVHTINKIWFRRHLMDTFKQFKVTLLLWVKNSMLNLGIQKGQRARMLPCFLFLCQFYSEIPEHGIFPDNDKFSKRYYYSSHVCAILSSDAKQQTLEPSFTISWNFNYNLAQWNSTNHKYCAFCFVSGGNIVQTW